ncbi:hypothetical protein AC1031_013511 [Aphanomyces cochlioides]|nr:hypothetical protein AC1031_013511 [Aphanomyces cochlioides]
MSDASALSAQITPSNECDSDEKPAYKKLKSSRQIVDSVHLSVLVASYRNYYSSYSELHPNKSQLVPSKVLKEIYNEYRAAHPDSPFSQETLKMRLRGELSALSTGELDSLLVLVELKMTNNHAKRNVLHERSKILAGTPENIVPINSGVLPAATTKPKTKVEMLQKQASSIELMAESFRESLAQRMVYTQAKLFKVQLANLVALKDLGVISNDEFNERAKALSEV